MADAPSRLGPYEIRREIGAGGMGIVFEGWDARLNRRVAVKTLWPALAQREEARERFLREARAAAAVSHANVTQIYDIGEDQGQVYFAMEYLEAHSVEQILREEGKLSPERAIGIARQTAMGLRAAAAVGIVHRDVKPSNLVFHRDGTLKVTDFGLAKHLLADKNLTLDGQTIGTPKYVSPEQASGGAVDARSDIYSLGATLYEMVTGRPPFDGATPMEVMLKHVREPVPPLQQVDPRVPRSLAALIHRMLSKQPGARPQSYDELLRGLDRAAAGEQASGSLAAATVALPTVPVVLLSESRTPAGFAGRLFFLVLSGLAVTLAGGMFLRSMRSTEDGSAAATPLVVESVAPTQVGPPVGNRGLDLQPLTVDGRPGSGTVLYDRPVEGGGAVLEIVDARHEITEDGRFVVTGQVANTGNSEATETKVRISLTDADGELINATEVYVSPGRLAEGDHGRFEAIFPDPHSSVRIVFELNWIS